MNSRQEKIVQFLQENLLFGQNAPLGETDSLLGLGLIDSTGVLELVTFLEREFGITVDDAELVPDNLDTIANLTRFVTAKQSALTPSG